MSCEVSSIPQVPIRDIGSREVQEAAKYAVREHNKNAKDNLIYIGVINGTAPIASVLISRQYLLVIEVLSSRGIKETWVADVFEDFTVPCPTYRLVSFKPVIKY